MLILEIFIGAGYGLLCIAAGFSMGERHATRRLYARAEPAITNQAIAAQGECGGPCE